MYVSTAIIKYQAYESHPTSEICGAEGGIGETEDYDDGGGMDRERARMMSLGWTLGVKLRRSWGGEELYMYVYYQRVCHYVF